MENEVKIELLSKETDSYIDVTVEPHDWVIKNTTNGYELRIQVF